jgi:DNA mismatch repair ATPase MutS
LGKKRDFTNIRLLFDKVASKNRSNDTIDEQTWKDLNMDEIYTRVDRAYTDPGEAVLYRILREPLFSRGAVEERADSIRFFQQNRETREKVQLELLKLGHQVNHNDIVNLLWRETSPQTTVKRLYNGLAIAAIIAVFLPLIFWSPVLILIPVLMFFINMVAHFRFQQKNEYETTSLPYLIRCIKTAKELSALTNGEIKTYTQKLQKSYGDAAGILKSVRFLFPTQSTFTDTGVLFQYFNIFFLLEARAFYETNEELNLHVNELRELYLTLGELDALISAASNRVSLPSYSEPVFDGDSTHLSVKDARQPLLENPVPVSWR